MNNQLPSEDSILSLITGDEIVLLGKRMVTTRLRHVNYLGEEHELMYFSLRKPGVREGYLWEHVRASIDSPEVSKGEASMSPNVLARLVATGDFYIG